MGTNDLAEVVRAELEMLSAMMPSVGATLELESEAKLLTLNSIAPLRRHFSTVHLRDQLAKESGQEIHLDFEPNLDLLKVSVEFFFLENYPETPAVVHVLPICVPRCAGPAIASLQEDADWLLQQVMERFVPGVGSQVIDSALALTEDLSLEPLWSILYTDYEDWIRAKNNSVKSASPNIILSPQVTSTKRADGGHEPGMVTLSKKYRIEIYHGEIQIVRKSTFQSHIARTTTRDEVSDVIDTLKDYPRIARASHNMWVYRMGDRARPIEDHDSDGEDAAGRRLHHLFKAARVEFGTFVMVSRWFGGVLLGASRFKEICNSARKVLAEAGALETDNALRDG